MTSIEKRETVSGPRYDVRWRLPDGVQRSQTFVRRKDAESYVRMLGRDQLAGLVIDPNSGDVAFSLYAEQWIETRLVKGRPLAPKTRSAYRELLTNTLDTFETVPLRMITPEDVRAWYASLLRAKGPDRAAKAYRLLRAVLNTAADDRRIGHNPCRIRGGGQYSSPERPLVDTSIVLALADAIDPSLGCLVLLAGFVGLRPEEMLALTRSDVDVARRRVRITATAQEVNGLGRVAGPPKSEAGKRTLAIPRFVADALGKHLDDWAGPEDAGLLFVGKRGEPLSRRAMYRAWYQALALVPEAPDGLRIYDLRHHAATLVARKPGVTTKELMAHIGHSSFRAALTYQHAAEERNEEIADFIDGHIASRQSRS